MAGESFALDRAKLVDRTLARFIDACFQNLYIEGWPIEHLPFVQRGLQTFEGVPEVYPHAFALIDALGPGRRLEVNWLADDWSPRFRARVGDVAYRARDLILETWQWPPGLDRAYLHGLVEERKRDGQPIFKRWMAEVQGKLNRWFATLTPEQQAVQLTDPPPFLEEIDPAKREQFDRIVRGELDRVKELAINPYA